MNCHELNQNKYLLRFQLFFHFSEMVDRFPLLLQGSRKIFTFGLYSFFISHSSVILIIRFSFLWRWDQSVKLAMQEFYSLQLSSSPSDPQCWQDRRFYSSAGDLKFPRPWTISLTQQKVTSQTTKRDTQSL